MTGLEILRPRTQHRFGWVPDRPDARDLLLPPEQVPETKLTELDLSTDHANPSIWNQLSIGSCTAHGTGRCYSFAAAKHLNIPPPMPSRLFIYWFERFLEGTTSTDSGAMIRDGFQVLTKMGVPPESEWPYDIAKFADKPPAQSVKDALLHETLKYERVSSGAPTVQHLKNTLALGFPVAGGFTVYDSFDNIGSDGNMPMPNADEGVLGGHCTAWMGFNDNLFGGCFKVANSWDTTWGDGGYFYMPYSYMTSKYCSDFWQAKVAQ